LDIYIPDDGILHSHRREKPQILRNCFEALKLNFVFRNLVLCLTSLREKLTVAHLVSLFIYYLSVYTSVAQIPKKTIGNTRQNMALERTDVSEERIASIIRVK
jgi:hypothetical protein